ncbi:MULTISPECIES: ankyrin repeat domain-containing protein [unclassified Streptomyces]|uniref:ankyrin repeat domain-containing protein n=1 Tax=unclassified Streptomyces TaxID=2593676 RepID=UPI0037F482B7
MSGARIAEWDGVTRRSTYKEKLVARRDRLADAARDADWDTVVDILDLERGWVNCARIEGRSGFTPFHRAAWHGVPVETAELLLDLGAWRTFRTHDGRRPLDLAVERGHHHLADLLRPRLHHPVPQDQLAVLQERLHLLIRFRAADGHGSDLPAHNALRLPELELLTELDHPVCWFPVPGMYGGFRFELRGTELVVESFMRRAEGSERTDRVTVHAIELEEGGLL